MTTPLLTTKFHIPQLRSSLIERPVLVEQLDSALERKLTLVCAPAGYGKTTVVSAWVQHVRKNAPATEIAWLSLDEGDNDVARFLTYLVSAVNQVEGTDNPVGDAALAMLHSPQPPPTEAVLTSFINDVAAIADETALVLDDYHLIELQAIHDVLTFLIEHLPPCLHLIIAARVDPPFPLAQLRARGQLSELRASDLRFSHQEAAEFLRDVMGLDLSPEDTEALEARIEGWIAGLQLAAVSMQRREDISAFVKSFTGSHRYILDYLVEEVLAQQSEDVRAFLLQTSILNRMTGPLCDAVRFGAVEEGGERPSCESNGLSSGQETLEALDRANLFIVRLDDERRWYRYHHLFADLLRLRFRRMEPEGEAPLHLRASQWYEQHGLADEAIEHALRSTDYARAASLLEEHVDEFWQRGEHSKLWRWQSLLPLEVSSSRPRLGLAHSLYALNVGQLEAAERGVEAAEWALDGGAEKKAESVASGCNALPRSAEIELRGRASTIRAFIASYRGDAQGIIRHARQALAYLPERDQVWRGLTAIVLGDAYGIAGDMRAAYEARLQALAISREAGAVYPTMFANLQLALVVRMQGQLQRTIEICRQQLQFADDRGMSRTAVVGWLLAMWGEVLAERNDLDEALKLAEKGARLAEQGGEVSMLGWSYLCLVRVLFSKADMIGAEEIVLKAENIAREQHAPPSIANRMSAWRARIWLAQGQLDAALQWVTQRGLDADGDLPYTHEAEYLVLARILIAQGRMDDAVGLLRSLLDATERWGRTSTSIEILVLRSMAFQADGNVSAAMTSLEEALSLAAVGGFVRIFVDEGPPMARLLYMVASRGLAPDYARRLLAAFPVVEQVSADAAPGLDPQSALIEPLSERELEVLQLIAQGLSNQAVASRLFLSLNTVKAHTRNIYGKLGVHSRTQATAQAQKLGLLPDLVA